MGVMDNAHRFLDLVARQLGADDARMELGGEPPTDPRLIWVSLGDHWRVVAIFEEEPEDAARKRARLAALATAFPGVQDSVRRAHPPLPSLETGTVLDHTLEAVAAVAGATRALVIDEGSPVIWGISRRSGALRDVTEALALADTPDGAGAEPADHRTARAIAWARDEGPGTAPELCVARAFGGVYLLVLVFDGPISELAAEGAVLRALPLVARLVQHLPPIEPGPGASKSKVLPLRST